MYLYYHLFFLKANLESPLKETESGVTFYNTLHCDIDIKMKNLNHNLHIAPYQVGLYRLRHQHNLLQWTVLLRTMPCKNI